LKSYTIGFDLKSYPPGTFTVVPYHGHSFIIVKEAGHKGDFSRPRYAYRDRYDAFAFVAHRIARYGKKGHKVGKFYLDESSSLLLKSHIEAIDMYHKE
jgi:hypothetical protein